MQRRFGVLGLALAIVAASAASARPAAAQSASEVVTCWIENLTPSVQAGAWASYVVHMDGGLGRYGVNLAYGDGAQDGGTYTSSTASFSHVFTSTGVFQQHGHVTGASSSADCYATTTVY